MKIKKKRYAKGTSSSDSKKAANSSSSSSSSVSSSLTSSAAPSITFTPSPPKQFAKINSVNNQAANHIKVSKACAFLFINIKLN
jgi:hypothetical protein